jgi:membrane protease YdiL (CAAX protease family)
MSEDITVSTYFVIALYPITMLLIPEPVSFRWWLRYGNGKPMPSEIQTRSEKNEGNLLLVKFVILVTSTIGLMRHTAVPARVLGFRPFDLRMAVLASLMSGLILVIWLLGIRAATSRVPTSEDHVPFLLREPVWRILTVIVVGALAEEYWRALSLHLLRGENTSVGWALTITAIVFGIGHVLSPQPVPKALGRIFRAAVGGLLLGALFLEFHSLIVPFFTHVIVNSFGAMIGRRSFLTRPASGPG